MNTNALLALIAELYQQLADLRVRLDAAQTRITELEGGQQ